MADGRPSGQGVYIIGSPPRLTAYVLGKYWRKEKMKGEVQEEYEKPHIHACGKEQKS